MMPYVRSNLPVVLGCLLVAISGIGQAWSAERESITRDAEEVSDLLERIAENTAIIREKTAASRAELGRDVGICENKNFFIMCTAPELDSRAVLARADALRRQIATDWLGAELSEGEEPALIHITLSSDTDEGLTLLSDRPKEGRHRIWLTTSKELAVGSTLAHELAHVVLHAQFPKGMPAWANEGIASSYDDETRKSRRHEILLSMAEDGKWPNVGAILDVPGFTPTDEYAYTVGASLTQFFLSAGSRQQFIAFVQEGSRSGWERALTQIYGIDNLQQQWQSWLLRELSQSKTASHHRHGSERLYTISYTPSLGSGFQSE